MKVQCNTRCQRVIAYLLIKLNQPTTWAGFATAATAFGINFSPEKWQVISTTGMSVVSFCLFLASEGRNKPDNPNLSTVLRGEMPPPKAAIVPPSTDGMATLTQAQVKSEVVDPAGEVHAQPTDKPNG
jgi:hypothetical protein